MRPLFTPPRNNVDGQHRRTRIHAAIWAAFAVGAVPALLAPRAGAASLNVVSDTTLADTRAYDDVTVRASNGTDGGSGPNGVPGRSVTLTVKSGGSLTATTLEIYGGNGGYGTDSGGNGGNGGDGTLTVESGGTLTAETINIYGGTYGSGNAGGRAGAATLKADTLKMGDSGLTVNGNGEVVIDKLTLAGAGGWMTIQAAR